MRYSDLAMNISLRYARDDHEAKDIVQNAFLKVFARIETFDRRKGKLENWISRIVINEALQLIRKRRSLFHDGEDAISLQPEVDPPILDQLLAEDILQLLRKLPDGYRTVFVLYVVEGYSHKEIAERLGIAEGASRSQLARGKRMMRRLINEQNTLDNERRLAK